MFILLGISVILLILLYIYGTRNYDYWRKRGVKYVEPVPYFGSVMRIFLQKINPTDFYQDVYRKFPNEKYVGFFVTARPGLVLRDPDIIKHVMSTDFYNFYSRGFLPQTEVIEPLLRNLFFADGDLWRLLRQKMTPAFTTSKLKAMFPLIAATAEQLRGAAAAAARGGDVDVRDLMARYTTDFIGAVGFGVQGAALDDDASTFRQVGKRIFAATKTDALRNMAKLIFPHAFKNMNFFVPMIEDNIMALMKGVMKERGYVPSARNDFIDQLMDLKQKGRISIESIERKKADGSPESVELEFDDYLMVGQLFVFFAAGFETSSSATSFALHQLAHHPAAQARCHRELDEVLARHGGQLSYDAVSEMKYLEMCFKEGMRIFPSLGFLKRRCEKDYTVPGTELVIEKGVSIIIPVQALQRDEKYFPEPDKFDPDRFRPENANFHKYTYMPFGLGPRACIGERLGHMQSLAGLAALLSRFRVEPSRRTLRHPVSSPAALITQAVQGGLPLKLVERKKVV